MHFRLPSASQVERGIRDSKAIDTESLCLIAGEKVWNIRCDLHVCDYDGNLADCCGIAAIASLLHFRRPDVSVTLISGGDPVYLALLFVGVDPCTLKVYSARLVSVCQVFGSRVTVHTMEERQPIPLALLHLPIPTTFAVFSGMTCCRSHALRFFEVAHMMK